MNDNLVNQVVELAKVHEKQECCGLPFCTACRAVVLIQNGYDVRKTVSEIDEQGLYASGTKMYLGKCKNCGQEYDHALEYIEYHESGLCTENCDTCMQHQVLAWKCEHLHQEE